MSDEFQIDIQEDLFDDTEWAPRHGEGFSAVRATDYIQQYWDNYHTQYGYETYTKETFLEDALYGLGVAIDDTKYRYAEGHQRFKRDLQKRWFKRDLDGGYL